MEGLISLTLTLVQRIKELADERKTTFAEIERKTGISNGQIRRWDTSSPKVENLQKVANFLDVSTDYLLGRTDKQHYYDLTQKDQLDIAKEAERMLAGLETDAEVNYYGEPLDDEDRDKLRDALELALSITRVKAKKKFTPKQYRDESDNK